MKLKKHNNDIYYAHLEGGQVVNLKTKSKEDAAKLAKAAKLEEIEFAAKAKLLTAETVMRLSAGGKINCASALDEWRKWASTVGLAPNTIYQSELTLTSFFERFKLLARSPSSVTESQVDEFVNTKEETLSAETRRCRLTAIKSFFSVCVARGYVVQNPSHIVRVKMHLLTHEQKEPRERMPFTKEELRKLAKLDDKFWRAAVLLGYEVGLRISDVAQLEWASLAKPGRIVVWTDKRDRRIEMSLSKELSELLFSFPKENSIYVFPDQARDVIDVKRRAQLSMRFKRVLEKMDIEGKSFHSLRHTFATERAKLGDTVDSIREKMGHTISDTTEGYIHR